MLFSLVTTTMWEVWCNCITQFVMHQGLKHTVKLTHQQVQFNYRVTASPYVWNHSVCQLVEHPTSVTLPAETCLGKDASVVCSASIDSLPVYYQSGRCTTMLIHSPASAIPLHTWVKIILKTEFKMWPFTVVKKKEGRLDFCVLTLLSRTKCGWYCLFMEKDTFSTFLLPSVSLR